MANRSQKKWLLTGSLVFLAFACQSKSGEDCNSCNKMQSPPCVKEKTDTGRCKDRPCETSKTEKDQKATQPAAQNSAPAAAVETPKPAAPAASVEAPKPAAPVVVEAPKAVEVKTEAAPTVQLQQTKAPETAAQK